MPEDVWRKYGRVVPTSISGDYLELRADDLPAIVSELTARGYRCVRDDNLVIRALGLEETPRDLNALTGVGSAGEASGACHTRTTRQLAARFRERASGV